MTTSTEARVRVIVRRVGGLTGEFGSAADVFRDLGLKSAATLDLLLSLEEEFSISISDEAFNDARSVDTIVALVDSLL
jgi:acyl carrier protein